MIDFASHNAFLIAFVPFIASLLIFSLAAFNRHAKNFAFALSALGTIFAFVLSVLIVIARVQNPELEAFSGELRWLTAGSVELKLGWSVDNLTAMMLGVVTFISLLVQLYSFEYMAHEEGVARYYGALSLFTFSMLLLVLADNLLVLYAGWELVGACSFLLIGFFTFKPEAAAAAKKAFIVNRIGDFGFLIGIMILFFNTGTFNLVEIAEVIPTVPDSKMPGMLLATACVLLFFGPIGKSAQFPLHVWLPDAMEGPTPVSALIHAATMVAAGVYLVAKVMGIFVQATTPLFANFLVMDFIAWIGGITALLAAAIAVTQTDIKRVLAYSTVSQLGFMMMALGMYKLDHGQIIPIGYTAGVFHLFTHAFFKAMLFLCSGSVIHAVHNNDMRQMGGLRRYMPITAATCFIGTASISGFPLFAGFWSKDEILLSLWEGNIVLFGVASLAAVLTAFYMFRLYFMTFEGEYRGDQEHLPHESGILMTLPLIILAIPSIFVGLIGTPWKNYFHDFIHFSGKAVGHAKEAAGHATEAAGHATEAAAHGGVHFNPTVMAISVAIFLVGSVLAYLMYKSNPSIDPEKLAAKNKKLYELSLNKFYFDEMYGWFTNWIVLGGAKLLYFFDKYIVDVIVNAVGFLTIGSGEGLKYTQTGRIQQYVLILMALLVELLIAIMWSSWWVVVATIVIIPITLYIWKVAKV